jgi:hypothetical protein
MSGAQDGLSLHVKRAFLSVMLSIHFRTLIATY